MTPEQLKAFNSLARSIISYGDAQFMLAIAASKGSNGEVFNAMKEEQFASAQLEQRIDEIADLFDPSRLGSNDQG